MINSQFSNTYCKVYKRIVRLPSTVKSLPLCPQYAQRKFKITFWSLHRPTFWYLHSPTFAPGSVRPMIS